MEFVKKVQVRENGVVVLTIPKDLAIAMNLKNRELLRVTVSRI